MIQFWQLPAPASFVNNVADDLRAGNNVVLVFPDHYPEGWAAAFRAKLRELSLPRLEAITVDSAAPLAALHAQLGLGPCPSRASATHICGLDAFHGHFLHLQGFTSNAWQTWRAFLQAYEDACRHLPLAQRTLFIATLDGELALHSVQSANLLRVHRWSGSMDGLNTRLYAAGLLSATPMSHWHRQLAVSLLAELALWDPQVCAIGAALPLEQILEPELWLTAIARDRNWSATEDLKSPAAEWRGLRQQFDGHPRVHSAWLALAGRGQALAQRLWSGQVTALFPLIERHRRGLLRSYRGFLHVPWETQFGSVARVEDLELNHIADQLNSHNGRGLRDPSDFAAWLRDLRNGLAHFTPIAPDHLLEPRFQSRMDAPLACEED
jgi:hypothetical protein